jgi:thiol-disulfide isomerase/thioredoxin
VVVGLHRVVQDHPLAGGDETVNARTEKLVEKSASLTNAGLVLLLLVTAMTVAWPRATSALGMKPRAIEPAYKTGQTIDTPSEWYASADHTLVVFARASCGACQNAEPFLKQLVADLGAKSAVVLGSNGKEPNEELGYARALGLSETSVRVVPTGLRVRSTPTLVLVDRQGQVLAAWEGVGPEKKQKEIRASLFAIVGN